MSDTKQIKITKNRDIDFNIHLKDKDGAAIDLTGLTTAIFKLENITEGSSPMELRFPLAAAANEVQNLSFSAVPDEGSYKITLGSETTTAIPFGSTNTVVQNAINALLCFSTVVVTGDESSDFVVTFGSADGGRNHPLIIIANNTLKNTGVAVTITPTTTTPGVGERGIDLISAEGGNLRIVGTEEDSSDLVVCDAVTGVLIARISAKDLNIPPLDELFKIEADPF